jgi:type II restriction enzyme
MNVIRGNLPPLYVVLKPKNHSIVERYVTISVGEEVQKPDMDILVYSDELENPIVIYSCKTSLRERAGQTYRWKLLLELATCSCPHIIDKTGHHNPDCPINKYEIRHLPERVVKVGFITTNFYKEIDNPQQRGMYVFFDYVYLASNRKVQRPVMNFSYIVPNLKSLYS